MIPKNNRPTETELRPIAMIDVSYKILMSLIGREIENHVAENKIEKFEQAGFTKGGNILDKLFILRECVEKTYRKKEQIVAIAIDFKKAYDSIKRETMVQILKKIRIDSKIIDFIVRIYREDSTKIQLEKNKEIEIEVTSGIRQGCTASTVLFKLITYKIIEEMRKTEGIQILGPKITCLFYADDGLILAKDKEKAERSIEIIREICVDFMWLKFIFLLGFHYLFIFLFIFVIVSYLGSMTSPCRYTQSSNKRINVEGCKIPMA